MISKQHLPIFPDLLTAKVAAVDHFVSTFGHTGRTVLDTESVFKAEEQVLEFVSLDDESIVFCCVVVRVAVAELPPVSWLPTFFN